MDNIFDLHYRFEWFVRMVTKNNTKQCYILECDIKKFFASVDQQTLVSLLNHSYSPESRSGVIELLEEIIFSFKPNGLPLGNLTSQLFANIYLNEFDRFVKHKLKVKYYIRYADDFVIFSENRKYLESLIPAIKDHLQNELKLTLHPDKIFIKTIYSGMDYLGWINFKDHKILRTKTKQRMLRRIKESPKPEIINSYLGLLGHGNTQKLRDKILD